MREWLKQLHILRIPFVFVKRMLLGFWAYKKLLCEHGVDTSLLGTVRHGIGDYYICASYLPAWLRQQELGSFVFLALGGGEKKVLELFPTVANSIVTPPFGETGYSRLLDFRAFLGIDHCRFYNFHHQQNFPSSEELNISRGMLQGFRGLNMVDFYLACGFGLQGDASWEKPTFSKDIKKIDSYFMQYYLKPGRTVLLAPCSTGLEEHLLPMSFWAELAQGLRKEGWLVCTNCAAGEKPVPGTLALYLPLTEIVPFLDVAGGFIGIRSGLCDVISTSICRKVILHTYKAKWWPEGRSTAFAGLVNMGLCKDAIELELDGTEDEKMCRRIIRQFKQQEGFI